MAAFSGAVRISDLNDYIAPSQSCVVALNGGKIKADAPAPPEVQLHKSRALPVPLGPGSAALKAPEVGDSVKVTLHDCLACSGCITSAETVLLQHQSGEEFLAKLADPGVVVVVSISAQSRAALAAFYELPPGEAHLRLVAWLRRMGVRAVFDLGTARDLALLETAAEFISRFRAAHPPTQQQQQQSGAEGMEVDTEVGQPQQQYHHQQQQPPVIHSILYPPGYSHSNGTAAAATGTAPDTGMSSAPSPPGPLPMLASACPGWVCYAEKTHGQLVLPHIASAKSPQAIMGSLVKRVWGRGRAPSSIYHVTIMPCYDKKLEASREELTVQGGDAGIDKVAEVDNCLTTGELHGLMVQHGVGHLRDVAELSAPDSVLQGLQHHQQHQHLQQQQEQQAGSTWLQEQGRLYGLPGGSGGYMDFVMRTAAQELFGRTFPPGPLPLRALRNADMQEVVLQDESGRVLLRCAIAYGFRNIQTIVRKMKTRRCEYHYVEVMACPSGCLAGGGQLKPSPGQSPQQLLEQLELAYHHQDIVPRPPADNPLVQQLYASHGVLGGGPGSDAARALLHTTYSARGGGAGGAAIVSDW